MQPAPQRINWHCAALLQYRCLNLGSQEQNLAVALEIQAVHSIRPWAMENTSPIPRPALLALYANGGELIADPCRKSLDHARQQQATLSRGCDGWALLRHGQDICFRLDQGESLIGPGACNLSIYRDTRQCSACECESNVSCILITDFFY